MKVVLVLRCMYINRFFGGGDCGDCGDVGFPSGCGGGGVDSGGDVVFTPHCGGDGDDNNNDHTGYDFFFRGDDPANVVMTMMVMTKCGSGG